MFLFLNQAFISALRKRGVSFKFACWTANVCFAILRQFKFIAQVFIDSL